MPNRNRSITENARLVEIAKQFARDQTLLAIAPLGNGLINDTYLVTDQNAQWVLQRINRQVFPEPRLIFENLSIFTRHLHTKPVVTKRLQIPEMLISAQNQTHAIDTEGEYWRAMQFIPNSYSKERVESLQDAGQIGWALGYFHSLCSDLDPARLHDTLPGFHIAPDYLNAYRLSLMTAKNCPRDDAYRFCVNFIHDRQAFFSILEDAKNRHELVLRVMHGDPKVNNFLFDRNSGAVVSLIDLDTVKPGLLHYDIGDCVRSACFNADANDFDLAVCEAVLKSYLDAVNGFFKESDYQYLYAAIKLIPLELGLRFFSDYLQGNNYFKVSDPAQNLHRAAQQFQLCGCIEARQSHIERLIQNLRRRHE